VLRDDTTLVERAAFVLELGTEAEEPTAPDTPTDADDTLTTLLFAIRVADLTVSGEEITSYVDYTEELPGFATYVTQTEHDADKAEVEAAYQAADTTIKQEVPWYATSDSAESTIAKIATCNQTGFALATGAKVIIKFDYTNTASSPTLNVNDTGDIAIVAYGTTAPELYWVAGDVVEFTYDGTSWVMHPTQGQVDTLNSNLTDLSSISSKTSITLAGGFTGGSGSYVTYGHIVFVEFSCYYNGQLLGGTLYTPFTGLPVPRRAFTYVMPAVAVGEPPARISVNNSGRLTLNPANNVSANTYFAGAFMYFV